MTIDKAALLAALMPATTTLTVDGFGTVYVRQITVAENDALRATPKEGAGASSFGLRLLATALVDETGTAIFSGSDLVALSAASSTKLDRLVEVVLEVNGYTKPAEKNAAASEMTPSAGSVSA